MHNQSCFHTTLGQKKQEKDRNGHIPETSHQWRSSWECPLHSPRRGRTCILAMGGSTCISRRRPFHASSAIPTLVSYDRTYCAAENLAPRVAREILSRHIGESLVHPKFQHSTVLFLRIRYVLPGPGSEPSQTSAHALCIMQRQPRRSEKFAVALLLSSTEGHPMQM